MAQAVWHFLYWWTN